MKRIIRSTFFLGMLWAAVAGARGTYQTPGDFLAETFPEGIPQPRVLWLKGELRRDVGDILGHRYPSLRIRYWAEGGRSAWILEEIGKEQPITTGVVVTDGRIERIRVLVFRESRGDEVRHPFFTEQFQGARLVDGLALDRDIDNISGATLSVRAMRKLGRLALRLDQAIRP